MQLDQNLEDVLQKILDSFGAQTVGIDEALTKQLSSLRSDMQRDVGFQLDSNAQKIVENVENVVQEALSRIQSSLDASSSTERMLLVSLARDVAFLR